LPEKLEFVQGDWTEYERRRKESIIEEIARELHDKHPELFDGSFLGAENRKVAEKLIRQAVLARSDVLPGEEDEIVSTIMAQASGYGPLAEFFTPEAAEITEVLVNPTRDGPRVWYAEHGRHRPIAAH